MLRSGSKVFYFSSFLYYITSCWYNYGLHFAQVMVSSSEWLQLSTCNLLFTSPDDNKIDGGNLRWKLLTCQCGPTLPSPSVILPLSTKLGLNLKIYPNSSRMQSAIRLSNSWCRWVGGGVNDAAGSYSSWVSLSLVVIFFLSSSSWTMANGKT